MNTTYDEKGNALTVESEGVSMPANYSFAAVNDFVHHPDTSFEQLQALCLGMATHIDKTTSKPKGKSGRPKENYRHRWLLNVMQQRGSIWTDDPEVVRAYCAECEREYTENAEGVLFCRVMSDDLDRLFQQGKVSRGMKLRPTKGGGALMAMNYIANQ